MRLRHPQHTYFDCKYPHFMAAGGEGWYALTFLECASGYIARWPGVCTKIYEKPVPLSCSKPLEGYGEGNPVVISTGDKIQLEVDPISTQQSPLQIARTYRTFGVQGGSLGIGWTFTFDRWMETTPHSIGQPPAQIVGMGDQGSEVFYFYNYNTGLYDPISISAGTIKSADASFTEWIYKNKDGRIDHIKLIEGTYKLASSHSKEGVGQYFAYNGRQLQSITDSFGRVLQVVWKNEYVIDSIVAPHVTVQYEYDNIILPAGPIEGTDRLIKVLVKDSSGTLLTSKQYHYEDHRTRYLLTGITDENGNRYSTYAYDDGGKAVLSEHAGGADRRTFSYPSDISRTVTDPLGTDRTFSLAHLGGYGRITSVSQPGGAGCSAGASSYAYDEFRNLSVSMDFNGTKTCYAYDPVRNLETGRIEGLAAASACPSIATTSLTGIQRKTLTQWHPDAPVKVKIAAPKKLTSLIYNGQLDVNGQVLTCAPSTTLPDGKPIAVLCKRIEQATSDSSGAAGFNAVAVGRPRIWTFTYNALGQMLTSTGPASEGGSVASTTYTYYADTTSTHTRGDLSTVTNAKGHVTEYLEYNKSGKVTRLKDPNGSITTFTYDPQSRLTSRTLGAGTAATQTTTFAYDGVGQLTKVTAPDASFITYTYDAAHRLTDISDGLGNTVHYTLDAAGNRVREEVKDPTGNLSRQVIRAYDPLNRLEQVTGASQ